MTSFNKSKVISLAILDHEIFFRKGLAQVFQGENDMELLGEAENETELLKQLQSSHQAPQVILKGIRGNSKKELDSIRLLTQKIPESKVVTLSSDYSKALLVNLLETGVAAFLPRHASPQQVEHCIHSVVEKGFFYSERVLEVMREHLTDKSGQKSLGTKISLSDREKDVLKLICEQYTNAEIAEELNLSTRTVEWHRVNLMRKLNCKNTAGLVAVAVGRNLVEVDFSHFGDGDEPV